MGHHGNCRSLASLGMTILRNACATQLLDKEKGGTFVPPPTTLLGNLLSFFFLLRFADGYRLAEVADLEAGESPDGNVFL